MTQHKTKSNNTKKNVIESSEPFTSRNRHSSQIIARIEKSKHHYGHCLLKHTVAVISRGKVSTNIINTFRDIKLKRGTPTNHPFDIRSFSKLFFPLDGTLKRQYTAKIPSHTSLHVTYHNVIGCFSLL